MLITESISRKRARVEIADAQRINTGLVLRAVATGGAHSRQQIVRDTGLSKATASRVVRRLVEGGLVLEGSLFSGPDGGRDSQILEFRGGQELVCGVDVGGTNTRVLVVDQVGHPVAAWRMATAHRGSGDEIATWLADAVLGGCPEVMERGLRATVVGVPGAVDPTTGEIGQAPNLRSVEGTQFLERLGVLLQGTIAIANDSNAAVVGEMAAGAGRGIRDLATITIGTGVGVGVILNRELLTGTRGLVGEFGVLPITLDGAVVEDFLGGAAAAALPTKNQVVAAAYALCASMAVAYDLEMIVFGGRAGGTMGEDLEEIRRRLAVRLPAPPALQLSELGDVAGALGAVVMALDTAHHLLGAAPGHTCAVAWSDRLRDLAVAANADFERQTHHRREAPARSVSSHNTSTRMDVVT